jgi:hypothetical protein
LLGSVETLGGIADAYGVDTLVDLMYLQSAILSDGFIGDQETAIMNVVGELPSAERWAKYIQKESQCEKQDRQR